MATGSAVAAEPSLSPAAPGTAVPSPGAPTWRRSRLIRRSTVDTPINVAIEMPTDEVLRWARTHPGFPQPYRIDVSRGIERLGDVSALGWRMALAQGETAGVPEAWQPLVPADGTVEVSLLLTVESEPRIDATANDHTVTHRPTTELPPSCQAV